MIVRRYRNGAVSVRTSTPGDRKHVFYTGLALAGCDVAGLTVAGSDVEKNLCRRALSAEGASPVFDEGRFCVRMRKEWKEEATGPVEDSAAFRYLVPGPHAFLRIRGLDERARRDINEWAEGLEAAA